MPRFTIGMYTDIDDMGEIPIEFLQYIHFSRLQSTCFSGLNLLWNFPYERVDGEIVLNVLDRELILKERDVVLLFYCLNYPSDVLDYVEHFFCLAEMPPTITYTPFIKEPQESGQAKLFVGTMELFIGEQPEVLRIFIIGSASSEYVSGGRTYDSIPRLLTTLGYRGTMELYDPNEVQGVVKIGNFIVYRFKEAITVFDNIKMKDGVVPTHIICDAYQPSIIAYPKPETVVPMHVNFDLRPGSHKFVIYSHEKCYYMKSGMMSHTDIEAEGVYFIDRRYSLIHGGGHYLYDNIANTVVFFGISENYGKFDEIKLNSMLYLRYHDLSITFANIADYRSFDSDYKIFTNNCIVSAKYTGSIDLPGVEIRPQFYYYGRELRAVKGPPIPSQAIQIGDSCFACQHIGKILHALKSRNGCSPYDAFKYLMSAHVDRTCFREYGQKQAARISMLREAAAKEWEVIYSRNRIEEKHGKLDDHIFLRLEVFAGIIIRNRPLPIGKQITSSKFTTVWETNEQESYYTYGVKRKKNFPVISHYPSSCKVIFSQILNYHGVFRFASTNTNYDITPLFGLIGKDTLFVHEGLFRPQTQSDYILVVNSSDPHELDWGYDLLVIQAGYSLWRQKFKLPEVNVLDHVELIPEGLNPWVDENISKQPIKHQKIDVIVGEFKCDLCKRFFKSSQALNEHNNSKHKKNVNEDVKLILCLREKTYENKKTVKKKIERMQMSVSVVVSRPKKEFIGKKREKIKK